MTWLVIKVGDVEKRYPAEETFTRPSLNDLAVLKRETGLSINEVARRTMRMVEASVDEVLDDADLIDGFRAFVWLTRRLAGESLSLDEANDFGWSAWRWDAEETAVEADPTRGAKAPARPRSATKTPRKRSAAA